MQTSLRCQKKIKEKAEWPGYSLEEGRQDAAVSEDLFQQQVAELERIPCKITDEK